MGCERRAVTWGERFSGFQIVCNQSLRFRRFFQRRFRLDRVLAVDFSLTRLIIRHQVADEKHSALRLSFWLPAKMPVLLFFCSFVLLFFCFFHFCFFLGDSMNAAVPPP